MAEALVGMFAGACGVCGEILSVMWVGNMCVGGDD
jgi:hypothetical protein